MDTRNYTGIEHIKDYVIKDVVPKYFDVDEVNDLNGGLLGLTADIQSTVTEDAFNTLSLFAKEAFPAQAQLPETIYTNASFLDINEIMSKPAQLNMGILFKIQDIIDNGIKGNEQITFNIDSSMKIDVEGVNFMPDYDIVILAKPHKNDFIFSAQYVMSHPNSISDIKIPYLKTFRVMIENVEYLSVFITAHQVNRQVNLENIIDNDIINKSAFTINYGEDLASFDALYREPGAVDYTPLKVIPYGSTPLKTPFCFYKHIDENTFEISFTVIDNYFQPVFNSEVLVSTHTTLGSKGNFRSYEGNKVSIKMSSEKYDYNGSIVAFAIPTGPSVGGIDRLSLEDLRYKTVEKWSTSGAYNTESDLQVYLSNYSRASDTYVTFVKKRDDMAHRLFSSFSLFKDKLNDIYPTNTLNLNLFRSDFDIHYEQEGRGVVRAGSIYSYFDDNSHDLIKKIPGRVESFDSNEEFMYTCPFVISVQKSPTIVGFYLNSIYKDIQPDYKYVNMDAYYQFILGGISLSRNAIGGENEYTAKVNVIPSSGILDDDKVVDPSTGYPLFVNNMKVVIGIMNSTNTYCVAYKEMEIDSYNPKDDIMVFKGLFETDDVITQDEQILINNVIKYDGTVGSITVPMVNTIFNIFTLYKTGDSVATTKKLELPGYEEYVITNTYSTETTAINLMTPMTMIRSRAKFLPHQEPDEEGVLQNSYSYLIDLIPMIDYRSVNTQEKFKNYISMLDDLHAYLLAMMNEKTNNFGVDLKFYNTYGRSKNFTVGEQDEQLDKVNISIHFKVSVKIGVDTASLIPKVRAFIKDYVENINTSIDESIGQKGYNAIYISNLIREIEVNFSEGIKYLRFIKINNYDSSVQVIQNRSKTFDEMTKEERAYYVPEYLTISEDDISIDIIE